MKYLKKIEWLPDALSDGTIVTPDGPFTLPPEEAIQYADYRFNKQQSMMPYNTVIALNRGEDCSDRNTDTTTFTKTFLSKIGKAPVIIRSELLPPNTITGDTEFDKTYPFWCLAVTIVSSEMDLTNTYLCLEACNTGHTHQSHTWVRTKNFSELPFEAKKYLTNGIVKYKTLPDSQSFHFTISTNITKLSLEGITQIKNPKVGKTYYLYISLPKRYLKYKGVVASKAQISDTNWNTYIKFRPCIKYKRENTNDVNMYTLPLSWPYELNCKFPQIFYSAWSTNTTTLPPPSITVSQTNITSTYIGKTVTINYYIEWPREDEQIEFNSPADWVHYSHNPEKQQITLTIDRSNITSDRSTPFRIFYGGTGQQIVITQTGVPVINLADDEVSANSLGGVFNVNYTVNNPLDNVTISTSESYDWISVGVESSHIVITISENTSTSSRTGTIYVRYTDSSEKTINVYQHARAIINLSSSSVSFSYNQSNSSYTRSYTITNPILNEVVTCTKSSDSWFTFSHDSNNQEITITVTYQNTSSIGRTGYVYLDYGNAEQKKITVRQTGKPTTTTTTTTSQAPVYYNYTITANLNGPGGSSMTTLGAYDENGRYAITGSRSSTGLSISGTFRFSNKVSSITVTATANYNGSQWTGSTTISSPTPNGSYYVTIQLTNSMLMAMTSSLPDDTSGDSNSLEDILLDYETDQI